MKRKVLALAVSAIMTVSAIAGIMVSAADSTYDASANAPEESVVLSEANLLYAAGGDVSLENSTVGEMANGFSTWTANGSGLTIDTASHYGDKAIIFAADWKSATGSFAVDMKKDTYYKFSFWYYCEPGGANSIMTLTDQAGALFVDVEGKGAPFDETKPNDRPIWFSGSVDGVWDATNCGSWKYVERILCPSDDVTRIDLIISGNGVAYYDDFCVLEIGASLPTPEPTPVVTVAPTTAPTVTPSATATASPSVNPTDKVDDGGPIKEVKKSVKFTKKSVKVKKGKKVTLKVKLKGAKKAKFSVDKKGKKVVKLSKKKAKSVVVTGKKKGKATITAKAAGKKATCKVTVK